MNRILLIGVLLASALTTSVPAGAAQTKQTVSYGTDAKQQMDVYYEPGSGQPWVMLVHGGSWMGGDRNSHPDAVAGFLAAGFAVISIDYRLSPQVGWPAQRDDVNRAVDYIHAHFADFGVDPDRGLLYGVSAGGHIAVSAAVRGASTQIRGVIGVSSVLQPLRTWQMAHGINQPGGIPDLGPANVAGWAVLLFRGPPITQYSGLYGRWRDGTPSNYVTASSPPALLVHSADDAASPIEGDQSFVNYMTSVGASARLITVPGNVHADTIIWDDPARAKTVIDWAKARTA